MQTDDGIMTAYGEYKEIEENRKLVFTWGWRENELEDSLVTLTFSESDGGTLLSLDHSLLPDKDTAEHHELGWVGSIDKLENLLNA